jgi:putative membrane protein
VKTSVKALTLIGLGLYLYSRIFTGTLLFYINQRFAWLVMMAGVVLMAVGGSYRYRSNHDHDHVHRAHTVSWGGVALIGVLIALGLLVPPKPLGASAMGNREVNLGTLVSSQSNSVMATRAGEKNILDWLVAFQNTPDPTAFTNQSAHLIGFVYRDDRFDSEDFMLSRFVVSCCVADATAIGLIVRWPQAASLPGDQWVEVSGHFEPGEFSGKPTPILVTEAITRTTPPNQPYLYP